MTRPYLELVGVHVVHSKAAKRYRIESVYVERKDNKYEDFVTMKGYDMTLASPFKTVVKCVMDAYAPVIKNVWRQADLATVSYYLQFIVCFRPSYVGLAGPWKHWAQW